MSLYIHTCTQAKCYLRICYDNNYGVEKYKRKADELYRIAVIARNHDTTYDPGVCFENGCGVKRV